MKKWIQLAVLFCFSISAISAGALSSVQTLLKFLEKQDAAAFNLDKPGKIVLMLGDSGTGVTTTTLLLTNATLVSIKDGKGSNYHIYDKNGRIGNISGISHSIIPEAFIDKKFNVVYIDCPGFSNANSAEHDITIGYLIQKLLTRAEAFKIVLIVNHSNVRKSGTHSIFPNFMNTIVTLFKNIDTYKEGIAMIATKAVKDYKRVDGKLKAVNAASYILQIVHYLEEMKNNIQKNISKKDLPENKRIENVEKLKLLEVLLKKKDGMDDTYSRIGVLHKASRPGSPTKDKLIQGEILSIKKMIMENLEYVGQNKSVGFNFVVSPASQVYVSDLIQRVLDTDVSNAISTICEEIKQYYFDLFEKKEDFLELNNTLHESYRIFDNIPSTDPLSFTKELINRSVKLIDNSTIRNAFEHIRYIEYLLKIKNESLWTPYSFQQKIDNVHRDIEFQFEVSVDKWVENLLEFRMPSIMESIRIETDKYYNEIEERSTDIYVLHDKLSMDHGDLSKVDITQPQSLLDAIDNLGINISEKSIHDLNDVIKKMKYAPEIVEQNMHFITLSIGEFRNTLQDLHQRVSWYDYMIELDINLPLSSLAISENATQVINGLIKSCDDVKFANEFDFNRLSEFVPSNLNVLSRLQNQQLNSKKKNTLKTILSTFIKKPKISCPDSSKMTVTGAIIKISQITSDETCFPTAQSIEIFASISVFVDDSIEKVGKKINIAIMSPVWTIDRAQTIILTGYDGDSKEDAKDCTTLCSTEHNGEAGYPGGPGGNFLGIGEVFSHGRKLTILSEGGEGGPGQNGGKGRNGVNDSGPAYDDDLVSDIRHCFVYYPIKKTCFSQYLKKKSYQYQWGEDEQSLTVWQRGSCGTNGSEGGYGGVGGFGGKKGHVQLIELGKKPHIVELTRDGDLGRAGKGGPGGDSAVKTFVRRTYFKWTFEGTFFKIESSRMEPSIEEWTASGPAGLDGWSVKNRVMPEPEYNFDDPAGTIQKFNNHLMSGLNGHYRESKTREFIEKLENDGRVQRLFSQNDLWEE